jgi:hypothetical protein
MPPGIFLSTQKAPAMMGRDVIGPMIQTCYTLTQKEFIDIDIREY